MTFSSDQLFTISEKIYQRYGYDFRNYNQSSLGRRVEHTMNNSGISGFDDFSRQILDNVDLFRKLIANISISVTSMFRDPEVFLFLREKVLPRLATYPHIRIWVAGVSTGEEAYSLAIMLKEENLYHRSLIYATDFNPVALSKASSGICRLDKMAEYTGNYINAGGKDAFSRYYTADCSSAHLDPGLLQNIVFSTHNLVTDGVFNEFHLVMCRNVLIYFDRVLTQRVVRLFGESMALGGNLCLGRNDRINQQDYQPFFNIFDKKFNTYQKC